MNSIFIPQTSYPVSLCSTYSNFKLYICNVLFIVNNKLRDHVSFIIIYLVFDMLVKHRQSLMITCLMSIWILLAVITYIKYITKCFSDFAWSPPFLVSQLDDLNSFVTVFLFAFDPLESILLGTKFSFKNL